MLQAHFQEVQQRQAVWKEQSDADELASHGKSLLRPSVLEGKFLSLYLIPAPTSCLLQIYDLKGSTRNRHVQSTGRENEVLLDENLVESMFCQTIQREFDSNGTP